MKFSVEVKPALINFTALFHVDVTAYITMTSHERHVVSNHRSLFNNYEDPHPTNIKVCVNGPLWGEFTGDRWIPRTEGQ